MGKEILSYFEWRKDEEIWTLKKTLYKSKKQYYRLNKLKIKESLFNQDKVLANPQWSTVQYVCPRFQDFNIPWEPIPLPSLKVPKILISTVQPIYTYMWFNVTDVTHQQSLGNYLHTRFFQYLCRAQEDPDFGSLTGYEGDFTHSIQDSDTDDSSDGADTTSSDFAD